jgi:hypothetical protein
MSSFKKATRTRAFALAEAKDPELYRRLMPKVTVGKPEECWSVDLAKDKDGYSSIKIAGRNIKAHRAILRMFSPHEKQEVARHICNNPGCVNPLHIKGGTQQDNVWDRVLAKRSADKRGENNGRAKLTRQQATEIRKGTGSCESAAAVYGVSAVMVSRIRRGLAWAHI